VRDNKAAPRWVMLGYAPTGALLRVVGSGAEEEPTEALVTLLDVHEVP